MTDAEQNPTDADLNPTVPDDAVKVTPDADPDLADHPNVKVETLQSAAKIPGALLRYRTLAWITGVWLLILVAQMIARYGFDNDSFRWIGVVHGWVYFAYLIFCVDLAIKARWSAGKTIWTALAGTIPFLSFWVEHIRTREVKQQFGL